MKLTQTSAILLILVIQCGATQAQPVGEVGSGCPLTLQTHGFLGKAQRDCDFPSYSGSMRLAAQSCFSNLPKSAGEKAILDGLKFFDQLKATRGLQTACNEVLNSFPGTFGNPKFFDLERIARSLVPLLEQERFKEAYDLALRLEGETRMRPDGKVQPLYASILKKLAVAQAHLGKNDEAIRTLILAIDVEEALYGSASAALAETLNNLAVIHLNNGKPQLAEPILRRALSMHRKFSDLEHVVETQISLAGALASMKRFDDAAVMYNDALKFFDSRSRDARAALIYESLGQIRADNNDLPGAQAYFRRAAEIYVAAGLQNSPRYAGLLRSIGDALYQQRSFTAALSMYEQALELTNKTLGASHPKTAEAIDKLSAAYIMGTLFDKTGSYQKQLPKFIELRRLATRAALLSSAAVLSNEQTGSEAALSRDVYAKHLSLLAQANNFSIGDRSALDSEAFEIAQLVNFSSAAAALRQMLDRMSTNDQRLSDLIKDKQSKIERRSAVQSSLLDVVARGNDAQAALLRTEQLKLSGEVENLSQQILREFPQFASLSGLQPISVRQAQGILLPDEALFLIVPTQLFIHVFALSSDAFQYSAIFNLDGKGDAVIDASAVAAFRSGLGTQSGGAFDVSRSYDLYKRLFSGVDERIKTKRHFNIVPVGELTALPFHLLVAKPPEKSSSQEEEFRAASWIIRDHAIAVLPSISSLVALRSVKPAISGDRRPLIGFANPRFSAQSSVAPARRLVTRGYTEFWKGAQVDRVALSQALPPLPDTEVELRYVAERVGALSSDLYFGERATERSVKAASLKNYQVIYFATHGLVAGDVKEVGEPSLALTMPEKPDAVDDGLLTASEVSQLSFSADWVVLSACNTISGDRPGAEALSGLARAFFYAGARALLVTHWDVESAAATQITTVAFKKMFEGQVVSRAEAMQMSMLNFIEDRSSARNSNPSVWGAFAVIGEGRLP
jgi:CHAT domain-containing protein